MALASPNTLASLVGLQNRLSRLIGYEDFASVVDTNRIAQITDAIEEATDTVYQDGDWKMAQAEGRFKTFASLSGVDGTATNNSTRIVDLVTGFGGAQPGDKIHLSPYEGSARISQAGNPSINDLDITSPYPGATVVGSLSWEIVRDEYGLAGDAWFITRVWDAVNGNPLKIISEDQLQHYTGEKFESLVQSAAEPRLAMITRWNPTVANINDAQSNVKMRLYPAPKDEELEIAYSYVQVPTWQTQQLGVGIQLASTLLYNKAATILLFDLDDAQRAMVYERKYQANLGRARRRETNRARQRIIMRPQFTPGASAEPFQIGQDPKLIQGN